MKRRPSRTVLLIGEGKTEKIFLKHLKSLYISRGCGVAVNIQSADGKGPEYIVNYAIRRSCRIQSDRILVLLDTDISIEVDTRNKASNNNIELVESTPCFEGLLLDILKQRVPPKSAQCKKQCRQHFTGPLTEIESYKNLTKKLLEKRRGDVPPLDKLLNSFTFI